MCHLLIFRFQVSNPPYYKRIKLPPNYSKIKIVLSTNLAILRTKHKQLTNLLLSLLMQVTHKSPPLKVETQVWERVLVQEMSIAQIKTIKSPSNQSKWVMSTLIVENLHTILMWETLRILSSKSLRQVICEQILKLVRRPILGLLLLQFKQIETVALRPMGPNSK